jgi:hypothetical protein
MIHRALQHQGNMDRTTRLQRCTQSNNWKPPRLLGFHHAQTLKEKEAEL